ncbi:endonuclease/exonuclease/phosphatase family protein [Candidatus Neomarinimicrobiota bacterium]
MVKIATFNVENLFARYRFRSNVDPTGLDGFTINQTAFDIYDETSKQITAKAIRDVDADVIALQEVESLPVLDRFNSRYLGGMDYTHRILVDAFDPRKIDVAVLSKHPIERVKTYRNERNARNTAWLFSRDCLVVEIDVNGKALVLYVNHFKSMMGGRDNTRERREGQVEKVAELITEHWKKGNYKGNFVVLGDFNDYLDPNTSLTALMNHQGLVNVSERIENADRWTHYWAGGNSYSQLDFILLSKGLAEHNGNVPETMRKGLPWRAERYSGERFDFVGESSPKASDHCPLYMDIDLG